VNAADVGDGERRWTEAGRPTVPSLVLDGLAHPVLHVSQIAELLGLAAPTAESPAREGADALTVLEAWLDHVRGADWTALLRPTLARGRTLRNLTVNVFHPFELLPEAWRRGRFPWEPEDDGVREERLATHDDLLRFAEGALSGWRAFLDDEYDPDRDPPVASSRGPVAFSTLVSFQRWHAAYHYRQLVHVLEVDDGLPLDDLVLPRDVF
jgi:hypothetical protein